MINDLMIMIRVMMTWWSELRKRMSSPEAPRITRIGAADWCIHSSGTHPFMIDIKVFIFLNYMYDSAGRQWLKIVITIKSMIMIISIIVMVMMIISTSSCSVCEWLKIVLCLRARTSFRWRRGTGRRHHNGEDHDHGGDEDDHDQEEKELGKCMFGPFQPQTLRYVPASTTPQRNFDWTMNIQLHTFAFSTDISKHPVYLRKAVSPRGKGRWWRLRSLPTSWGCTCRGRWARWW